MGKKKNALRKKKFIAQKSAQYEQEYNDYFHKLNLCVFGEEPFSLNSLLPEKLKFSPKEGSPDIQNSIAKFLAPTSHLSPTPITLLIIGIIKVLAWNLAVLEQIKGKDEMQLYRKWLAEKLKNVLIFEGALLTMLELSIKYKKLDLPKELFFIEKYNKLEWQEEGLIINVSVVTLSGES